MWFAENISWRQFRRSLGGFSAIVCKDASTVWAEDPYGKTIAQGEAGVDDASVIQSALDLGGRVFLNGKFYIDCPISINNTNSILEGINGATLIANMDSGTMLPLKAKYGAVRRLRFNGNSKNVGAIAVGDSASDCIVSECEIFDCLGENILSIHWSERCIVEKCYLRNLATDKVVHAIYIAESKNCIVKSNIIVGNGCIDALGAANCYNNIISNNILLGDRGHGGIYIREGAHHCIVNNNYVEGAGKLSGQQHGDIELRGYNCVVEGNICKNSNGDGIQIFSYTSQENCYNNIVQNNVLADNAEAGISVFRTSEQFSGKNTISGNSIKSCKYGILIEGDGLNKISGNLMISLSEQGIYLKTSKNAVIANLFQDVPLAISVLSHQNNIIGNLIYSPTYGISISNGFSNCVALNKIYSASDSAIKVDGENAENNFVMSNFCADSDYGIFLGSPTSNNHILYNFLIGNTTAIRGAGSNIIKNNIGYATENSGVATFSGDGTTTDFEIGAHGLVTTDPSKIAVKITPVSSDAIAASPCVGYVDPSDNTKIRVKFSSAPASGSENVKIVWYAEVVS